MSSFAHQKRDLFLSLPIDERHRGTERPKAKFIIPDWGDKVDSGIGLSYRPARLHTQAGQGVVNGRGDGVRFLCICDMGGTDYSVYTSVLWWGLQNHPTITMKKTNTTNNVQSNIVTYPNLSTPAKKRCALQDRPLAASLCFTSLWFHHQGVYVVQGGRFRRCGQAQSFSSSSPPLPPFHSFVYPHFLFPSFFCTPPPFNSFYSLHCLSCHIQFLLFSSSAVVCSFLKPFSRLIS